MQIIQFIRGQYPEGCLIADRDQLPHMRSRHNYVAMAWVNDHGVLELKQMSFTNTGSLLVQQ